MKHSILKITLIVTCLALAVGAFPVKADTSILVTVFDQSDFNLTSAVLRANGTTILQPLPPMGVVSIGYFGAALSNATISSYQETLTLANVATLAANWVQFGVSMPIGPNFNFDSTYDFTSTDNLMAGSSFIGKNVYTFIGNALTYAASTEVLVYNHATAFVQESPLGGPAVVSLSDSQRLGQGGLLLGHFGSSPHSSQAGNLLKNPNPPFFTPLDLNNAFGLEPIPEPSRALLALVGVGACFLRRRR